ncbi:MAG: hypothetical protein A2X94_04725 [Bdellovibrionales bacterium GWB1_55_8]|nr:MAG: hypothetical protein A2X94_04725 [Bdellovibrionales bacterium GWB1_55_8]
MHILRAVLLFSLIWLSSSVPSVHASPGVAVDSGNDPLFGFMLGEWEASGERVQIISGRRIRLHADIVSELDGRGRLVSWNRWTEVPEAGGNSKIYERTYWIAPTDKAGVYHLGMVNENDPEADARVEAVGRLTEEEFTVEQVIPSTPPIRVRSVTRFRNVSGNRSSETSESVFMGDRQVSGAQIHFRPR